MSYYWGLIEVNDIRFGIANENKGGGLTKKNCKDDLKLFKVK